ncbi:MAG: hypothetical protein GF388_09780 [Candidatus Aegiribacteria sp.]|nr:hypothetical protein [Candidatus Aegiribacteria sp.]MBD3295328.1 hypothetical protein [Candidatus Fermentibacteria bacterium]
MIEDLLEYVYSHPPGSWAGPLMGLIAFTETLFPPLPGDVIFVVVTGWAVSGGFPVALSCVCGLTGCFLASCLLFFLGHKPGKQFVEGWLENRVGVEKIDRARDLVHSHGPLVLAASRFIPGVRSLLVLIAGSSGMKFAVAVVPILISASVWYLILALAGSLLGASLESAQGFMARFGTWTWVALAASAAVLLLVKLKGRKKK